MKMTSDLLKIASAGASIALPMNSLMTSDLVKIASALQKDATLTLAGKSDDKMTSDLVKIASAGKVHFIFNS